MVANTMIKLSIGMVIISLFSQSVVLASAMAEKERAQTELKNTYLPELRNVLTKIDQSINTVFKYNHQLADLYKANLGALYESIFGRSSEEDYKSLMTKLEEQQLAINNAKDKLAEYETLASGAKSTRTGLKRVVADAAWNTNMEIAKDIQEKMALQLKHMDEWINQIKNVLPGDDNQAKHNLLANLEQWLKTDKANNMQEIYNNAETVKTNITKFDKYFHEKVDPLIEALEETGEE